jgi:uncharacterized protein with HEPN domain
MSSGLERLKKIVECINDIDLRITQAIENKIIKPAIRMNIVRIAEQFAKLKDDNQFKILEQFKSNDLKGINSVRNYIAHDYDSTDDNIIEDVIRYYLPIFNATIKKIKIT